ncbi:hypothetical protein BJ912DRAFT_93945 [Pholiota molesta]|nr:hypothetical protein BJ912DRAFT_93945 [Pholiota molesta]
MKPRPADLMASLSLLLLLLGPALASVDAHIADSSNGPHNDGLPASKPSTHSTLSSPLRIPSSPSPIQAVTETLNKDATKVTPFRTSLPSGKNTESSNSPHTMSISTTLTSITTSTSPHFIPTPLVPIRTHRHSSNPHGTHSIIPTQRPGLRPSDAQNTSSPTHIPSTSSAHHASQGHSSSKIPISNLKTITHHTHHSSSDSFYHHHSHNPSQATSSTTKMNSSSITNTNFGATGSISAELPHTSDGIESLIPPFQSIIPVNITGHHTLTTLSISAPKTIQSQNPSSPGDNHLPSHSSKSTKASSPSTSHSILRPTSQQHHDSLLNSSTTTISMGKPTSNSGNSDGSSNTTTITATITSQSPTSFSTTPTTQSASGFKTTTHANLTIYATTATHSSMTSPTGKHTNPTTTSTSTFTAPNSRVTDRNLFFWGTQEVHPESVGGVVIGIAIVVYILAFPVVLVLLRRRYYRENPRVDDEVREFRWWGGRRGYYAAL